MKNVFRFESVKPRKFRSGTLHRATKKEFPVLKALAIQALLLEKGSVREPHLHPNAQQLDYCVTGRARVGIIGPEGHKQYLTLSAGDISFVPQGYIHWIENIGNGPLHFLVTLSHEQPETIELSEILAGVPKNTLSKVLGIPSKLLNRIPSKTVTIGGEVVL
jgi:oxalate decarboxylase/phosphoglucose isomerase-like protein (cupin superfamily)